MRELSAEAIAQIATGAFSREGAVKFEFGETYRLWSGYGPKTFSGDGGASFTGCGGSGLIRPVSGEMGGGSAGMMLSLSGLDPDIAATIEAEDYRQKPVTVWMLIFPAGGQDILGSLTLLRGRCDGPILKETVGGSSTIEMMIENSARDLGRSGARIYSDEDQRVLGGEGDGSMKHISVAGVQTLYWGKKPESARNVNAGANSPGVYAPGIAGLRP